MRIFINGETFYYYEKALIALEEIQKQNIPAVITFAMMGKNMLRDGYTVEEGCRLLSEKGALVVGMNCFRGPNTMQPYLEKIRDNVDGYVAGLPIPYRTTEEHPTFFNLPDMEKHFLFGKDDTLKTHNVVYRTKA